MTELRVETLTLPGCPIGAENPLPIFRDKATDRPVALRDSIPTEKRQYFGWQAGARLLPYRLQDQYNRQRADLSLRVIVLENEFLKATFWTELGGRLMSLIYKPLNRELLYNNPVFQPANLAIRNAWFAGGIEWNVGHYGHSFLTCTPIFAAVLQGQHGEPGLRLYDFERCKGLLWQTDFYLPPHSEFLIAYTRVVNPQDEDTSMYWWTNIAVPELPGLRVLAPTDETIYLDLEIAGFGYATLPDLPSLPGKDPTYSLNWPRANEFFFQCDRADLPWEAALDAQGAGLVELSSPRLKYRKLFCWGTGPGGRHWQEFLAEPGLSYLEIQAGLAPTQLHHLPFASGEEWDWTELFGFHQADPAQVHDPDYRHAWRAVDATLKQRITPTVLAEIEAGCRSRAAHPASEILQNGSGWGALELARRAQDRTLERIPPAFVFPPATLGPQQTRWLPLLQGEALAAPDRTGDPGEWLVQKPWRDLLARSLQTPQNRTAQALLHYGVMLAEAFDDSAAADAWRESLQTAPSPWAYRNLAALAHTNHNLPAALDDYARAWQAALAANAPAEPLAREYLALLVESGAYPAAQAFYAALPAHIAASDRIQVLRAMFALQLNDLDTVEQILQQDFPTVREGQVDLTDLWFQLWRRRLATQTGQKPEDIPLSAVEADYPVPKSIDFRMKD
jgi:hypothetical protein